VALVSALVYLIFDLIKFCVALLGFRLVFCPVCVGCVKALIMRHRYCG